jgi:hypothetical protein
MPPHLSLPHLLLLPQICDFLGSQQARYVSESQVKAVLGFTGSPKAHRQWRRCGPAAAAATP